MPLIKDNQNFEWHGVKCADCAKSQTIKLKVGALLKSPQFDSMGVFRCSECRKVKVKARSTKKVKRKPSRKVKAK